MCNEQGGTVDDLYLYRLEEQSFMMVVNASNSGGLGVADAPEGPTHWIT